MRDWQLVVVVALATVVLMILGVRGLLRGRRVPTRAKLVLAGAIMWLLSPIDVLPDVAFPVGLLDDLAVLIAAVRYVLDQLQPPEMQPPGGPQRPTERRALDWRLDRRDAIEPTNWRIGDDREPPTSS